MRIHLLPFCVSCAVCPSLLLSQALPYAYVIADLEEGTNLYGIANAMNARGDVVGDSNFQAFVWSHGTSSTPASLGNGFSTARGINDFGQVVGGAAPNGTSVAFLLDSRGLTTLELPSGTTDSLAEAINNKGQVLLNTMAGSQSATFLWTQGTTREIPSLGGFVQGNAVNELGEVVGQSSPANASLTHAFLCSGGQSVDLGVLPGGEAGGDCGFCVAGNYSAATAINDSGAVVGQSAAAGQVLHAFLWRGGFMMDLGTLASDNRSYASSINNRGQVVGWSGHATGVIIDYTSAVLWEDGTLVDLNDLIPADSRWVLDMAAAINMRGQIAGTGHRNGIARAFLLTPVHTIQRERPER